MLSYFILLVQTVVLAVTLNLLIGVPPNFGQNPSSSMGNDSDRDRFPEKWNAGLYCETESKLQIHQYNKNMYIVRQSLCTNFEGPFLYVLFGNEKVLMIDTGTGVAQLREAIDGLISQWLSQNRMVNIKLVIAHTHSHADHVGGDEYFLGRTNTEIVGWSASAVQSFFGFENWSSAIADFDLGGRTIKVIPTPGHHPAHIAFFDTETRILFSGDTIYPGRLYFPKSKFSIFKNSISKLKRFSGENPISWILGSHIEMTDTPKILFSPGSTRHPDEHILQLESSHLRQISEVLGNMQSPQLSTHDDFVIYPLPN